jgi:hypothetical protein
LLYPSAWPVRLPPSYIPGQLFAATGIIADS